MWLDFCWVCCLLALVLVFDCGYWLLICVYCGFWLADYDVGYSVCVLTLVVRFWLGLLFCFGLAGVFIVLLYSFDECD